MVSGCFFFAVCDAVLDVEVGLDFVADDLALRVEVGLEERDEGRDDEAAAVTMITPVRR